MRTWSHSPPATPGQRGCSLGWGVHRGTWQWDREPATHTEWLCPKQDKLSFFGLLTEGLGRLWVSCFSVLLQDRPPQSSGAEAAPPSLLTVLQAGQGSGWLAATPRCVLGGCRGRSVQVVCPPGRCLCGWGLGAARAPLPCCTVLSAE